ncbi:hypothetical protein [Streptomyces sp. NRRL F-2580]|nr:hypothetical protein [Streptomyces sp. NRRL F-2580]
MVLLIVAVVCAIGLVTLSNASPDTHVIFNNDAAAGEPLVTPTGH